jgi:hypothetical protein
MIQSPRQLITVNSGQRKKRAEERGRAETYVFAPVAGEGEEIDLVAVADAAVPPQVRELRRSHRSPEPRARRGIGAKPAGERLPSSPSAASVVATGG